MKEERKKISFREELTVSKFSLWGGFIVSLLLSFSVYLFFTSIRDLYRLFSLTEDFEYLKFTSEELQFYNLFYAFLGLIIGLHFFIKINLDKNKSYLDRRIQFTRKKAIANQKHFNMVFHVSFFKICISIWWIHNGRIRFRKQL